MKKVLAISIVGVWVLVSCKKDYTCKCTTTIDGVSTDTTYTITKTNVTKSDADAACKTSKKNTTCDLI